jgi:dolichol-phosphate mannosyltransferase
MAKYSFVVPAYNEEEVLHVFYDRVTDVFKNLDGEYELIFVNDGSRDKTEEIIALLSRADKRVKGVSFSRNFGQQSALLCGLSYASGDAVVAMDADLQDPPEVALQLIEKWKEGYDVVHARHKKRAGETVFKRLTAAVYYRSIKGLTGLDMPVDCGDFKLLDRKVVNTILSLGEHARLLRAQVTWIGFKQTIVEFDRPARAAGETKYTLKKMLSLARKGIIPNGESSLGVSAKIGGFFIGGSVAAYIVFIVLSVLGVPYGGAIAWLFPTITLCTGILLLNSGLQNAYIAEIYTEEKNRPHYIVRDTYNIDKNSDNIDKNLDKKE